jgi:hypothetical protein
MRRKSAKRRRRVKSFGGYRKNLSVKLLKNGGAAAPDIILP